MQLSIIGIDLGKTSCRLVGVYVSGKVVLRRPMRRNIVIAFSKVPACMAAMEACCSAHHIGRVLAGEGHEIRLMSPEYVRPYVKPHKNDNRDAHSSSVVSIDSATIHLLPVNQDMWVKTYITQL